MLPLNYWPGKPSNDFLGPRAWDKDSRKLKLGSGGLNLTVVKPIERDGGKNKSIDLKKMIEIREITNEPDLTKVVLGATFDYGIHDSPDFSLTYLELSRVILDKSRYWITITDFPVRSICTHGEHIIYIEHNSNIKVTRGGLIVNGLKRIGFFFETFHLHPFLKSLGRLHCFAD